MDTIAYNLELRNIGFLKSTKFHIKPEILISLFLISKNYAKLHFFVTTAKKK